MLWKDDHFCTWPKLGGVDFFLLDGPWIYFYWANFYFDTLKFIYSLLSQKPLLCLLSNIFTASDSL